MEKDFAWQTFAYELIIQEKEIVGIEIDFDSFWNDKLNGLVLKLSAEVLKEDMTNRRISTTRLVKFEHPRSPWQYFKFGNTNKWWVSWFVKLFPIKFKTHRQEVSCFHSINPMLLFPEQVEVPRKFGRVIRFVDIDEGEFRVYHQAADYRQTR